jgi:hypothetical protein
MCFVVFRFVTLNTVEYSVEHKNVNKDVILGQVVDFRSDGKSKAVNSLRAHKNTTKSIRI